MPNYNDLIKTISSAVDGFNKSIPGIQTGVLDEVLAQIKNFDLDGNRNIKNSVKNIRLLNTIKNRLHKVILTPDYKDAVKEYMKVFTKIGEFQKSYFREIEKTFKPPAVINEIKTQTIDDVLTRLTEAGIGVNVSDKISDILKQNITTGTSYAALADQLREFIKKTNTPGILERYVKQIAVDSANQYSAQYMNTVSGDLGYEWFRYQGKDILTTRPFCDAMTDRQYFHISEVPDLLKAKDLYYSNEDFGETKVPIYAKTGLPHGLIEGTTVENFFVRRGGYNCGHQVFPVIERIVPKDIVDRVKASEAYRRWAGKEGIEVPKPPTPKPAKKKEIKFAPKNDSHAEMERASKKMMEQLAGRKFDKIVVSPTISKEKFERFNKQLEKLGNEYDAFQDNKIATPAELSFYTNNKSALMFESDNSKYGYVRYTDKGSIIHANFGSTSDTGGSRLNKRNSVLFKSRVDDENKEIATVTHEFAHTITRRKGETMVNLTARAKKFWKEFDVLKKEYRAKLKELSAEGRRQDYYDYHLGEYASTNSNELLAEAFTEYKLSSSPSEMAVKIGKLVDKYYKR